MDACAPDRDQFREANDANDEAICLLAQCHDLVRYAFGNITLRKSRGIQKHLHVDLFRSLSIPGLNDRPLTVSGVACLFHDATPERIGTISAMGLPLRKMRTVSPPSTASK